MNQDLNISDLIIDYQSSAQEVVDIFQRKFGVDNLLEGWYSGKYEQTGKLTENGLKFYAFHGIGIAAHFEDKMVDFDFAYMPELRHDGFDLWRLTSYVENQPKKYAKFLDKEILKSEFNNLIKDRLIANPKSECLTTLYFWTKDLNENQMKNDQSVRASRTKSWWKFW